MTEQKNELVVLVGQSGLEQMKQNQITEALGVFFNKASEWDSTIQTIMITSPDEYGKMKMAREGRLALKGMRLDALKLVKQKRDEVKYRMANDVLEDKLWLKAGQMIEATFQNLETKLEEKEKFADRWYAEQREKLRVERRNVLLAIGEYNDAGYSQFTDDNGTVVDLGLIDEDTFQSIKTGLEVKKKEREEAERIAEKARQEELRISRLHSERKEKLIPVWNFVPADFRSSNIGMVTEKVFREVLSKAKEAKKHYDENQEKTRKENERLRLEAEQREREYAMERKRAREEKEKADAEARQKLDEERRKREKLDAMIKKKEAEEAARVKAEREAAEAAAKAPKKEKLQAWVNGLSITAPTGMEDEQVSIDIISKFNSFKRWASERISEI